MNKKDLEKLGFTAEVIKTAGLSDDVLDQIIILHGKDIEKHKTDLTAAQSQVETLKGQVTTANDAIKAFGGKTPEQVTQSITEWETKYNKAVKDGEDKVAQLKFDTDLDNYLKETFSVNDPAELRVHLKMDTIKRGDDGKLTGVDEQVKPLQEKKSYLFKASTTENDEENPDPVLTLGSQTVKGNIDAFDAAMLKGANLPADTKLN